MQSEITIKFSSRGLDGAVDTVVLIEIGHRLIESP